MQLNSKFFRIAMNKMSLFKRSQAAKELLHSMSDVTGIPILTLLYTERRVATESSLIPLKELLTDKTATRADRLKYRIGLTQKKGYQNPGKDHVATRFNLSISTERGQVDVEINILVRRKQLPHGGDQQQANISLKYRIASGLFIRRYRQELVLAGVNPALRANPATVHTTQVIHETKTEPVYHFAEAA